MDLSTKQVNVAVQVLPVSKNRNSYSIVDKAIEVIQQSGVKYVVTPFETVMEGEYNQLMDIVKRVQEVCYSNDAENLMCYVKIQSSAEREITIDDKIGKYK